MDVSFQLYSARNFSSLGELLPMLKELGYGQFEAYGDLYAKPDELRQILRANGLDMPSGHFSLEQLQDVPATLKIAGKLGIKTLICPWLEPIDRPGSADGWHELAAVLEKLSFSYAQRGLTIAWHNHDFEFLPLDTGETPMQLLLDTAPSIGWQFDAAWSVKAGENPLAWIKNYGPRIISVHVKDIAPAGECLDEDGWADVGQGSMDWREIFAALKAHSSCKSFVVEHDNPNDILRFARRSIAAINAMETSNE